MLFTTAVALVTVAQTAKDTSSLDNMMIALYDVISGPPSKARDWDRLRALFVPTAHMAVVGSDRNGKRRHFEFTVDDYIKQSAPIMEKEGFFEREIGRHVDTFGGMTNVFSSYESKHDPKDKKPLDRGINSLQLVNDGTRWWIISLLWQGEEPNNPIPRKFLSRK